MITNNKQATGNQSENVVLDNPCNRVKPPKTTLARDKIKFFTLEQTKLFLGALDAEYSTSYSAHNRIDDTGKAYHVSEYTETRTLPLHGLRHTSATLLISQNVDVKTVSSRLGHSNTSTTLDVYAHALQNKDTQASEILGNLLSAHFG